MYCAHGAARILLSSKALPFGSNHTASFAKIPRSKWYEKLHLVELSCKDYIREDGDYDHVLLNPKWPVMPCVILKDNEGLMVMVCRYH